MLTWLEIDYRAILHNVIQFKEALGNGTLLMTVIKANAYGHGFRELANLCAKNRNIDWIAVVNLDEASELVRLNVKKPVLILSFFDFDKEKVARAIKKGVRFPLYTIEQAKFLNKTAKEIKARARVHLKVDTGASRVGILPSQVVDFALRLRKTCQFLDIEGIWSHFSSSEEDEIYTDRQYLTFQEVIYQLQQAKMEISMRHMACTAAAVLFPKANFNAVRLGLGMYGLYPSMAVKEKLELKPALSWHTKIIQIKKVPSGTKIGYGGAYTAVRETTLAVIPVGYWDGYDRRFSNSASVIVKGILCPVRGRICMNLTMIDVTDASGAKVGDRVTLIGKDGDKSVTVDELASIAGTINYEIVDRINPLLPRIIINHTLRQERNESR